MSHLLGHMKHIKQVLAEETMLGCIRRVYENSNNKLDLNMLKLCPTDREMQSGLLQQQGLFDATSDKAMTCYT